MSHFHNHYCHWIIDYIIDHLLSVSHCSELFNIFYLIYFSQPYGMFAIIMLNFWKWKLQFGEVGKNYLARMEQK